MVVKSGEGGDGGQGEGRVDDWGLLEWRCGYWSRSKYEYECATNLGNSADVEDE